MVTAFIKALCDEMRGVAKSMSKEAPKAHQNPVQDAPKPFKIEAWDAPGSQNVALKLPSAAKRQPRAPQKCPRDAQEAPQIGQEPAKSGQKLAQGRPRERQTLPESTPRRAFYAIFVGSFVRKVWGTILCRFLA